MHPVTACHRPTGAVWCRQHGASCSSMEGVKGGWLELGELPVIVVGEGRFMLAVILLMS